MKLVVAVVLAGTHWTAVDGPQTLHFSTDRVSGFAGCNRFGGSYEARGNALHFGPMMATRMACYPETMMSEHHWLGALGDVRQAELRGRLLLLKNGAGEVVLTLRRKR